MIIKDISGVTRLSGCLLLVAAPLAVRADLTYENINGTGLIYDSTDNTTWTQDADISNSTFTYSQAQSWAATLGSSLPGVSQDGWVLPNATEFRTLFLQLDGTQDKYGSQVLFGVGPNDYASNVQTTYWTVDSQVDFNFFYGYGGTYDNANTFAAWAIERAPEPSAGLMGLITFGLLGGGLYLRRRTVRA